jgi:hypothetical protein
MLLDKMRMIKKTTHGIERNEIDKKKKKKKRVRATIKCTVGNTRQYLR